jgi:hypothetical protein
MKLEKYYALPEPMNLILITNYKVVSYFEWAYQSRTRERGPVRKTVAELKCGFAHLRSPWNLTRSVLCYNSEMTEKRLHFLLILVTYLLTSVRHWYDRTGLADVTIAQSNGAVLMSYNASDLVTRDCDSYLFVLY